jgi:hypothetical protein
MVGSKIPIQFLDWYVDHSGVFSMAQNYVLEVYDNLAGIDKVY